MIKKLSNQKFLLLAFSFVAIFFLCTHVVNEGYLGYILIRSESLDEILYFVHNIKTLDKVHLVSLVKSMSDTSISFLKFIQALEINHVIVPTLFLIVYDINRVYFQNTQIKVAIIMSAINLILKYLVVIIIALILTPSVMNPVIIFKAVGFMLIVHQVITVVCIITMFSGLLIVSKTKEAVC